MRYPFFHFAGRFGVVLHLASVILSSIGCRIIPKHGASDFSPKILAGLGFPLRIQDQEKRLSLALVRAVGYLRKTAIKIPNGPNTAPSMAPRDFLSGLGVTAYDNPPQSPHQRSKKTIISISLNPFCISILRVLKKCTHAALRAS